MVTLINSFRPTLIRINKDDNMWLWYDPRTIWELTAPLDGSVENIEVPGFAPYPSDDNSTHIMVHALLQSRMLRSLLYTTIEGQCICLANIHDLRLFAD